MKNLWRAFKLILPYRMMLFWYVVTSIGLAICGSTPLLLVKAFLGKISHKEVQKTDTVGLYIDQHLTGIFGGGREYYLGLSIAILVLWFFKAFFDAINGYIATWMAQSLRLDTMRSIMARLLTLDLPFYDKHKTGDLVSRMVSDGEALRKTVKIFLDFLQQPFKIVVLVGWALYCDWRLFLLSVVGLPLVAWPLTRMIKNINRNARKYQVKTASIAQAMLQNLAGIRIIQTYGTAERRRVDFNDLCAGLFKIGMRSNLSRSVQRPLTELLMGAGLVTVLYYGGTRVDGNPNYNPDDFIVFIGALVMLYDPVRTIMSTITEIAEFLPAAERTFEILDIKPTIQDAPGAKDLPPLQKEIVFENLTFDYGRGPVLNKINLTIKAGEKIGIVGSTGSGKSTLLSLLPRFYDPGEGRITIDGQDIRSVTMASVRAQIALVHQNPFLFHATVEENIRYGLLTATDEDVQAAAKAAMVHDEIMHTPQGYKTMCGERGGDLFSGGQKQRIAVARAFIRNAPILLLDEATSALDTHKERQVQEAFDRLVANRTCLIVAHRLSTLRNVDRIVVVGPGGVIEAIGTSEELLQISPTFRLLNQEQHHAPARAIEPVEDLADAGT